MATRMHPNIANLIQAESGGNPNARSPKGAMGLAQAMPGTARDPGYGVAPLLDPYDPVDSKRFANDYYSAMEREFGNPEHAAVAYNWGPGNTKKWLAQGGDWSKLPAETQAYVPKVTGGSGNNRLAGSERNDRIGLSASTHDAAKAARKRLESPTIESPDTKAAAAVARERVNLKKNMVTDGAPTRVRAAVGNAVTAEDRLATIKEFYPDAKPYGEDNFVYTDPETGKPSIYNPEGLDWNDLASVGRTWAQMIGAVPGAVAGAVAGPLGIAGGAAVGSQIAGQAYDVIGRQFLGTEDNRTLATRWGDAASETILEGALNLVIPGAAKLAGRGIKRGINKVTGAGKPQATEMVQRLSAAGADMSGAAPLVGGGGTARMGKLAERSVVAPMMKNAYERTLHSLDEGFQKSVSRSSGVTTKESAGGSLQTTAQGWMDNFTKTSNAKYDDIQLSYDTPISLEGTADDLIQKLLMTGGAKNTAKDVIPPKFQGYLDDIMHDGATEIRQKVTQDVAKRRVGLLKRLNSAAIKERSKLRDQAAQRWARKNFEYSDNPSALASPGTRWSPRPGNVGDNAIRDQHSRLKLDSGGESVSARFPPVNIRSTADDASFEASKYRNFESKKSVTQQMPPEQSIFGLRPGQTRQPDEWARHAGNRTDMERSMATINSRLALAADEVDAVRATKAAQTVNAMSPEQMVKEGLIEPEDLIAWKSSDELSANELFERGWIDEAEFNLIDPKQLIDQLTKTKARNAGVTSTGEMTWGQAKALRSYVGKMAHDRSAVSDIPKGQWQQLYADLTDDMRTSIAEDLKRPDVLQAWDDASNFYREGMANYKTNLDAILDKPTTERAFQHLFSGAKNGGSVIRGVRKSVQEMDPQAWKDVVTVKMRELGLDPVTGTFDPKRFVRGYGGLPQSSRDELFAGTGMWRLKTEMDNFFKIAQKVKDSNFVRPHGGLENTAAAGIANAGITWLTHPVLGAATTGLPAATGYLMTRPSFVKWLGQGMKIKPMDFNSFASHIQRFGVIASGDSEMAEAGKIFIKSVMDNMADTFGKQGTERPPLVSDAAMPAM